MRTTHTRSGIAPSRSLAAGAAAFATILAMYSLLGGWYTHARFSQVSEALEQLRSQNAAAVADLKANRPELASIRDAGMEAFNAWNALWIDNLARGVANALETHARDLSANAPSTPGEADKTQASSTNKTDERDAADAALLRHARAVQPGLLSKLFGPEQFISYILALWAVLILAGEAIELGRQRTIVARLEPCFPDGMRIRPDSVSSLVARLRSGQDKRFLAGELTYRALQRFERTKDVAASDALVRADSDAASSEFNSRLSMVRFVIWAIPSIGFIGTVRGIGSALGNASDSAKLPEVVSYLGVAFDTTFVALLLSILLVLLSHEIERRTDQLLEDVQGFSLGRVVRRFDPSTAAVKE